jgi:hypothetical protein
MKAFFEDRPLSTPRIMAANDTLLSLWDVFQLQSGDEFPVMLQHVDPSRADHFALADWVGEDELLTNSRDGRPLARANFRHALPGARINKLDQHHS